MLTLTEKLLLPLEQCVSVNDESKHWLNVCELHRDYYSSASTGPFVIPKPPPKPTHSTNAQAGPSSTTLTHVTFPHPQTPSKFSVCSSAATSPSLASSPVGLRVCFHHMFHFCLPSLRSITAAVVPTSTTSSFSSTHTRSHCQHIQDIC